MLATVSGSNAQTGNRQKTIDSLVEVINTQRDSSTALRQYIYLVGLSNDTLTKQFDAWIKQFPKSRSIPYTLAEAYYKARDRKTIEYLFQAYDAGDEDPRLFKMLSIAEDGRWDVDIERTPNTRDSLSKVIENSPDSLLPLRQYVFVFGSTSDTVVAQFAKWMDRFPRSSAIPLALGEAYYSAESPKAKPYLLKVIALKPDDAKVYEMLYIDAERWGKNEEARDYIGKAAAAAPNDPSYAMSYAFAFENVDRSIMREKVWELVKKFPDDKNGAEGLFWLAYTARDNQEKISVFEQLGKLYPPAKFDVSANGMNYLFDLYLQAGLTDKAIELAGSMKDKEGFPGKLELAQHIADVRRLVKDKKYKEAQESAEHIRLPRYSGAVNMVALLKAEVRDAAGSTQVAYDSLLVLQSKVPDDAIGEGIARYGKKLGRSAAQTEADLQAIRDKASRPAPPFELGLYASDAKVKLEDYRGKVVLLTFWFPGCGPCRGEMPHFQSVVNKYDKKDLAYLGINVSPDQDDYVLPFMRGTKFSFTPLRGTDKWAQEVYKVRGEPTNFLIDRDGKIVYSNFMINATNEHMLELMINSMLERKG